MATVVYEYPVAGATAPTSNQSARISEVSATVQVALYDTSVTITHNLNIATADLGQFPEVVLEPLVGPDLYNTIKPFVLSKTAQTVVLTVADPVTPVAATPHFRVRICRPSSLTK